MLLEPRTHDSVAAAKVDLWWRGNADTVRAYLHHHTERADVDDLVQEVFILALRRWEVVPEPPIGWLLKTARQVAANHRRGARRYRGMVGRVVESAQARPAVDTGFGDHAARAELTALLAGMSANDREVLVLTAWYGLTTTEAADVLGITANAYSVRLFRARARLSERPTDSPEGAGGVR